ncbi:MAG TPA: hypothetical protein VFP95_00495, partial [Gammaproteobacteria bacterium]|nr:hypothetical protein [Gammaproteobacteria bacterium]
MKSPLYKSSSRVVNVGGAVAKGARGAQLGKNLLSQSSRILTDQDVITRLGVARDVMHINGIPVEEIINASGTMNPTFANMVLQDVERVKKAVKGELTETELYAGLNARIDLIDEPVTGLVDRMTGAEGDIVANQSDITALEATVNDPATGVDANASAVNTLDARITTNEGAITANASDITTLQAEMNTAQGDISGNATAIGALDSRVTTNEGAITANATAITALESTVNDPATGVDANAAAVSILETAVSNNEGDISANASAITTLQTEVDDNTAAVQINASSIDGLEAQIVFKTDVNGHVAGMGLASTTNDEGEVTSDIIMLADRFSVGFPASPWAPSVVYAVDQFTKPTTGNNRVYRCINAGTTGSTEPTWSTTIGADVTSGSAVFECTAITETIPFVVAMVEGNPTVVMDNAMIESVTAGKITAGIITATGIYLGDTTFELDGFNKRLRIQDAQATTRVDIGKLGAGDQDYGIRVYNAQGQLTLSETGLAAPGLDPVREEISATSGAEGNLIPNGYLITKDNYLWSEFEYSGLMPDMPNSPDAAGIGALRVTDGAIHISDAFIPVNPDDWLSVSAWARQSGGGPYNAILFGFAPYTANKVRIQPENVLYVDNTSTTLSTEAQTGDTVVHVNSAANWTDSGIEYMAFSAWFDFRDLPNYKIYKIASISGTTITLETPLEQNFPAGGGVREHKAGAQYMYTFASGDVPAFGTIYRNQIYGTNTDYTQVPADQLWPGTRYLRVMLLANVDAVTNTTILIGGLSMFPVKQGNSLRALVNPLAGLPWYKIEQITGQDPRFAYLGSGRLPNSSIGNIGSNIVGGLSPLSADDTVQINIAAYSVRYADGDVSYGSGSISGKANDTRYTVYADDPARQGGSVPFIATTEAANLTASDLRIWVGDILTPTPGGGASTGGGGSGCIDPDAVLIDGLHAADARQSDIIDVCEDGKILAGKIENEPKVITRPRVRLSVPSGAELICSVDTPIEQP